MAFPPGVDRRVLQNAAVARPRQIQIQDLPPSLQQQRASLASPRYANGRTAAAEPLVIDLPVAPKPGEHWVLDSIAASGFISTAVPPAGQLLSPVSGFFLVPQNTPPETLAQAQAGVNLEARTIPLPVLASIVPLVTGWSYAIYYNGVPGKTIPSGWTIRMIVSCNPGDAAPGPGALSTGLLVATVSPELDLGVLPG